MSGFASDVKELVVRGFWATLRRLFGLSKGQFYRLTGRSRFTPEQQKLLALMRRDNAVSNAPFQATRLWVEANKDIEDKLHSEGIGAVESQWMNELYSSPPPDRFNVLRYAAWMLYEKVKSRDRLGILERVPATVKQGSGREFLFEGCYVSWDLLISIDALYSIGEVDDSLFTKPVVVLDLGAGWGRIGYVLKSMNPNCVYVICDLPETLLVSSTYLPRLLPSERIHTYYENREVGEFSKELLRSEGGVRFCGAQDLARFSDKSIDFFINIASFQEMSLEQVKQYFEIIDRKVEGPLYLQQYWRGREVGLTGHEISGFDSYPFLSHWKRCYVRNTSFSNLYFEAAYIIP